jgi:hypothetical protein
LRIYYFSFVLLIFFSSLLYSQENKTYTIAVLDLEANGVSAVEAKGLSEKVRSRISFIVKSDLYLKDTQSEKYVIVERSQMDKIFEQFQIQNTGCVSDSCAVAFGRMLQVDRIVIGSVSLLGKTYSIATRMIDVETAKTIHSSDKDYQGSIDNVVTSVINDVADELVLGIKFDDWRNAEFVSVNGIPNEAKVTINGNYLGETPLINKLVPVGRKTFKIRKRGYENYTGVINLEKGRPQKIDYTLIEKSHSTMLMKSVVFPGSGQRYGDHKAKGFIITALQTAALAGTVFASLNYINASDEYDEAKISYKKASDEVSASNARKIMDSKYDDSSSAFNLQMSAIGAFIGVYLWNVIDAAVTEPEYDKTVFINPGYQSVSMGMRF